MKQRLNNMGAVIGFFDGVHLGHRHLIDTLLRLSAERGLTPMAVTFDKSPRQVLRPHERTELLTTAEERLRLLHEAGLEHVEMLTFGYEQSQLTAREFMQTVLHDQLDVRLLVVGHDTRFGRGCVEGLDDYRRYGDEMGIEVVQATVMPMPDDMGKGNICSSAIRRSLSEGNVEAAARMLGRCYTLGGTVVKGLGNGHKIGFPTANLQPDNENKLIPAHGVYATMARIDDGDWRPAMTDIGVRPTFGGEQLSIETHVVGLDADLYGHKINLNFVSRLRDERLFDTPEALARQLADDRSNALAILSNV